MTDLLRRDSELRRLQSDVRQRGFCEISLRDLGPLCPEHLSVAEEFACIAQLAAENGWSFAFLPNRSVLFRPL